MSAAPIGGGSAPSEGLAQVEEFAQAATGLTRAEKAGAQRGQNLRERFSAAMRLFRRRKKK